jgi:hypothetical protein
MAIKIKNAIKEFLSGFDRLDHIEAEEIADKVKEFSKSKTPEQSINVALNALWKKGVVEKYYLKEGDIFKYPTEKTINKKYERLYRIREKEYVRKVISIDEYIFCGQGKERKEPIYITIKMWTFEDNDEDREDFLKGELLEYIQGKYGRCYNPEYRDIYIDEIKELEEYAYDDSEFTTNPDVIYPDTDMIEE